MPARRLAFTFWRRQHWLRSVRDLPRPAPDSRFRRPQQIYLGADYSGKTLILAFILTDCSHCQFTTGLLKGIQKDYAPKGVEVLDPPLKPCRRSTYRLREEDGRELSVGYNDQNYAAKFLLPENEPLLMPQIVFIDRHGIIRRQFAGDNAGLANPFRTRRCAPRSTKR